MIRLTIILAVLTIAFGCSSKNMYESIRMSQQANCSKYEGIQREKCLADVKMSYQKYKDAQ